MAAIAVAPQIAKPPAMSVPSESEIPNFLLRILSERKTVTTMSATASSPLGPTSINF